MAGSDCAFGYGCAQEEDPDNHTLAYKAGEVVGGTAAIITGQALNELDPQGGDVISSTDSRSSAFRQAKIENDIPTSQQPDRQYMTQDTQTGRNLRTWDYTNSSGSRVTIREDIPRSYPKGGPAQGHHFNAGPTGSKLDQHYYFTP